MTKLLDQAVEAVRRLPPGDQDEIARALLLLAGSDASEPLPLSADEREAVAQYGSSDSGASLGDILGAALKARQGDKK